MLDNVGFTMYNINYGGLCALNRRNILLGQVSKWS